MSAKPLGKITSADATPNLISALKLAAREAREEATRFAYIAVRYGSNVPTRDNESKEWALQYIAVERTLEALIAALDGEWEANGVDPTFSIKETLQP